MFELCFSDFSGAAVFVGLCVSARVCCDVSQCAEFSQVSKRPFVCLSFALISFCLMP